MRSVSVKGWGIDMAYTAEEDQFIIMYHNKGKTWQWIAAMLGRDSAYQVEQHHAVLVARAEKNKVKVRTPRCLVCRERFETTDETQYIHKKCRVRDASPYDLPATLRMPYQR